MSHRNGPTLGEIARQVLASSNKVDALAKAQGKSYSEVEDSLKAIIKQSEYYQTETYKAAQKAYRERKAARLNAIKDAIR